MKYPVSFDFMLGRLLLKPSDLRFLWFANWILTHLADGSSESESDGENERCGKPAKDCFESCRGRLGSVRAPVD